MKIKVIPFKDPSNVHIITVEQAKENLDFSVMNYLQLEKLGRTQVKGADLYKVDDSETVNF